MHCVSKPTIRLLLPHREKFVSFQEGIPCGVKLIAGACVILRFGVVHLRAVLDFLEDVVLDEVDDLLLHHEDLQQLAFVTRQEIVVLDVVYEGDGPRFAHGVEAHGAVREGVLELPVENILPTLLDAIDENFFEFILIQHDFVQLRQNFVISHAFLLQVDFEFLDNLYEFLLIEVIVIFFLQIFVDRQIQVIELHLVNIILRQFELVLQFFVHLNISLQFHDELFIRVFAVFPLLRNAHQFVGLEFQFSHHVLVLRV